MKLENAAITIRPRNGWESMDLGFRLAQKWFGKLWKLWLLTGFISSALSLLVFSSSPFYALLFFGWLKPLYEPFLLYWLSRAVFGEVLPIASIAKQWRRILLPGLLANLTWRRFSPERSFLMPVLLLEGLTGDSQKQRKTVLNKNQTSALWLSLSCCTIEYLVSISLVILIYILIPDEIHRNIRLFSPFAFPRLNVFLYMLAASLVAPLYVAAGFMLYISRRVELEAWDIEIGFKNMAARGVQRRKRKLASSIVSVCILFSVFFSACYPSLLQAGKIPPPKNCEQILEKILDGDDFGTKKVIHRWKPIDKEKKQKESNFLTKFLEAFFKQLGIFFVETHDAFKQWSGGMATLCEVILWMVLAGGSAWLINRYTGIRRIFTRKANSSGRLKDPEPVLFGMLVTPESLPYDIVAECRTLFKKGETRKALALLYRGTLSRLLHVHELRVPDSATEMECNSLVKQIRPEVEAQFFYQLTCCWLKTAYGHYEPIPLLVQDLIDQWARLYGKRDES